MLVCFSKKYKLLNAGTQERKMNIAVYFFKWNKWGNNKLRQASQAGHHT
jgi:hypothetical protein